MAFSCNPPFKRRNWHVVRHYFHHTGRLQLFFIIITKLLNVLDCIQDTTSSAIVMYVCVSVMQVVHGVLLERSETTH